MKRRKGRISSKTVSQIWANQQLAQGLTGNSMGSFPSLFPLAKIAAQTIGMDLVSVQPLSAPLGKLFYMDPKDTMSLTPLERLKAFLEIWKDFYPENRPTSTEDTLNYVSARSNVKEAIAEALPWLDEQGTENALNNWEHLDELIRKEELANSYGI